MTVQCPIKGCDWEGDDVNSTATHAFTSGDELHKGVNYQKAQAMIETTDAADSDSGAATAAAETTDDDDGGGGDPAMDTPEASSSGDDSESVPDCPECGGELIAGVREEYEVDVDYICSKCGQGWVDE